ncbi:MAG: DOMON-like domain-containing protein [Methylococcales bacterium]|nr:DOMON-like domain-containing protein [Methylococcales bacterium]
MASNVVEKELTVSKSLTCHADTVSTAVRTMNVKVESQPEALRLSYELTGDLGQIRVPAPQPPIVIDGLWEHTCFELFIGAQGKAGYREFNFSPSGRWAAYAFDDYRMRNAWTASRAPVISFAQSSNHLLLEAVIAAEDLPQNKADEPFQLGLTAVIEANDGRLSYWALHHPEVRPDFHHRAGFILSFDPA